jgi:L-rhamnose-H+ transport protein
MVPDFLEIYKQTPSKDLGMIYLFGLIQGTGSYIFIYATTLLGLALGCAIIIGFIMVVSLLIPLLFAHLNRITELDGITLLIGLALLLCGIALSGKAGVLREKECPDLDVSIDRKQKRKVSTVMIILVVVWAGLANSMYYFSFEFQQSMKAIAIEKYAIKEHLWGFLNVVPLFLGMFTINVFLTVSKMIKEHNLKNYWSAKGLSREYILACLIALLWYVGQGICYVAGHTMLGSLGVAVGAALFMGSIMLTSNISGIKTGEWKGVSRRTMKLLYAGLIFLIIAMTTVSIGNYLQERLTH